MLEIQPSVWKSKILNFKCAAIFLVYSYSENKTCSENIVVRALKGRIYKLEKSRGHVKKSHVFKSWLKNMFFSSLPHAFYQFVYPSFESPCHAVFRTGLVFTVAITKKNGCASGKKSIKTAQLGGMNGAKPLCVLDSLHVRVPYGTNQRQWGLQQKIK